MPVYLKQALPPQEDANNQTTQIVSGILNDIEQGGEAKALEYATKFDGHVPGSSIVLSEDEIQSKIALVPEQIKKDIQFAYGNIKKFAEMQRSCIQDMEFETSPGFRVGQKCIPLESCGAYVPGGRYSHIASALMTITTAKVAGCKHITVCSPPRQGEKTGIHPAIIYAAHLCGADTIVSMGGVQAIASMTYGLFGITPADIIVGPGNQFVAEAKRLLYGRVGIDMFAGPTDSLEVADSTADAMLVAMDLVGQAEHGHNSPVWLITDDEALGRRVMELVPGCIETLPQLNRINAEAAWRDFGEVIVCENRNEMLQLADKFAPEHLHVSAVDLDWWRDNLSCYGSLFLGEETTVPYGDKAAGPNHCLPTSRAARYTGGLSIHKYLKIVTWQQTTPEASKQVAEATARISRFEGMEGHARCADIRLKKYFPNESFVLDIPDQE